jgi:hypothetical protein
VTFGGTGRFHGTKCLRTHTTHRSSRPDTCSFVGASGAQYGVSEKVANGAASLLGGVFFIKSKYHRERRYVVA